MLFPILPTVCTYDTGTQLIRQLIVRRLLSWENGCALALKPAAVGTQAQLLNYGVARTVCKVEEKDLHGRWVGMKLCGSLGFYY